MTVAFIDPPGMRKNPAFTQVVAVEGAAKTIYVGAVDPMDEHAAVVGAGDVGAQTAQVLANLRLALTAAGAAPEHVVMWRIYLAAGQSLQHAFEAFQKAWPRVARPPANTVVYVAGFAHPDVLVTIDAVAVVA